MTKNIKPDTEKISDVIVGEIGKYPDDKILHYSASNSLCLTGRSFVDTNIDPDSPLCIFRGAFDSLKIGFLKELQDSGKPIDKKVLNDIFEEIDQSLMKLFNFYRENLNDKKHEDDILADIIGIGHFILNQSIRQLNYNME